tara:strand:+ start:753 stop:1559 length:807 start_codon:yes stop_codon:yes gene_type:complete
MEKINKPDLKVSIQDSIIPKNILNDLADKCPHPNDVYEKTNDERYEGTLNDVGLNSRSLGIKWNVPWNDSYTHHGVVLKNDKPHPYLNSLEWKRQVGNMIGIKDFPNMKSVMCKYKTHVKNSNGVFLHTDRFVWEDYGIKRNILVLIYVNDEEWKPEYGGELLLFSNKNNIDKTNRNNIEKYIHNRPLMEISNLSEGDIIRTSGIGGPWAYDNYNRKPIDCRLEKKVSPDFGRVVVMDNRDNHNVHAVPPKNTFYRRVIEHWFYYENN